MFGPLATAVRDLANDNIITAVMLTGVMFLQVTFCVSSANARRGATTPPDPGKGTGPR